MGKHRAPVDRLRYARPVATTSVLALLPLAGDSAPAKADHVPQQVWDAVAQCESGNRNIPNSTGASSAKGYFQIIDGTWAAFGGREFASNPMLATRSQQQIVAERILRGQGPNAWAEPCNDPLNDWISRGAPPPAAPPPPPPPAPEPPAPAAPPPPAPVEEPVQVSEGKYLVEPGDTLVKIGAKLGRDWRQLADINGITAPWTIYPGEELLLDEVAVLEELVHVVEPGDTISKLALTYGICAPEDDIKTCWQPIYQDNLDVVGSDPDLIFPGEELVIRMATRPPVPPSAQAEAPSVVPPADDPPEVVPDEVPPAGDQNVAGVAAHPLPTGSLNDGFGAGRNHRGIDLDEAKGAPVYAAFDGIVREARCGVSGFGCWIVLDHKIDGQLVSTVYGHLHEGDLLVSRGQTVLAGQQITRVGNNGIVQSGPGGDGSHLHFEVWTGGRLDGGTAVDPRPFLADRGVTV